MLPNTGRSPDEHVIELRLSDIWRYLRQHRLTLLLFAGLGGVLGGLYGFSKPNEYAAQVTVMPELQAKSGGGLGNLGSLAGLAGVDLAGAATSETIRPDLYPSVLQTVPFAQYLLKQPVYSQQFETTLPLQTYMERQQAAQFPGNWFGRADGRTDSPLPDPKNYSKALQVSSTEEGHIQTLRQRITAELDKKTGILIIAVLMPDPVVAATVARLSLEYLTNYVTSYRTEKTRSQANFLAGRVADARRRYQAAEYALESYRDRNRSLYTNIAKLEEQRLQADFLLAQTVYNDLSKQLEQAKIKVQEDAPVFKVLEPPRIPLKKSGPKRSLIILAGAFIGAFAGLLFVLSRTVSTSYAKRIG